MPKYFYSCKECEYEFRAYHSAKEKLTNCPQCEVENGLVRKVSKVYINSTTVGDSKKVGDLTKEFIESNRDVLKDYKKELENNEYDVSNNTD